MTNNTLPLRVCLLAIVATLGYLPAATLSANQPNHSKAEVAVMPAFSFNDINHARLSTYYASNAIKVEGIRGQAPVRCLGQCLYRINGGKWRDVASSVKANDHVEVALKSANREGVTLSATLRIGMTQGKFNVSTAKKPVTTTSYPLATQRSLSYLGGFKIPNQTYGESRAGYAEGRIALGANRDSLFLVGHAQQHAIAEFSIPALVYSQDIRSFNTAYNIQPFATFLNRTSNPQALDRVGGLALVNGNLIINAYQYYDAPGDNTHTTLTLHNANNLAGSTVSGYDSLDGRAHASGWISPIPAGWQSSLKGSFISGFSSGIPIISRASVGPSAFAFSPEKLTTSHSPSSITTNKLYDYNLSYPIGYRTGSVEDYLNNKALNNRLWTHLSTAAYGFILPNSRSYMVLGNSGGHDSGVGYKITQDNGKQCAGYCAYQSADNYSYYWLFDLDDIAKVAAGTLKLSDVMPYEYGRFDIPLNDNNNQAILGGAFDDQAKILYLTVNISQGMEPVPVVLGYAVK